MKKEKKGDNENVNTEQKRGIGDVNNYRNRKMNERKRR